MHLSELRQLLQDLNEVGFVQSERKGATGIGYTLEEWLGVSENNLPIPDIGGRVEIKATRNTANNLITLFTFNRAVWRQPQAEIIRRWGYTDSKGRLALYSTVSATAPNTQGLQVSLPARIRHNFSRAYSDWRGAGLMGLVSHGRLARCWPHGTCITWSASS